MDAGSNTKSERSGGHFDRGEERRDTNWIALIRLPDGTEIPTTVRDISASGARLAVPISYVLPKSFMFKVIGRDFICAVQLVWRRGDYAGVRIERVGKVPSMQARRPAESLDPGTTLRARRSRFSEI
ncbi:PilZ domain-containing protein [Methylobacterium longum]|uniref:PilZ domain-containing protein n=1 Tax=Methylobacterium longum TaxID=767694 RepID=A0ABT8AP10_9HYPH|nr:PilZ domain-containing protein [Methylobacterium longum]MDN3571018.1 PilZ domain-containing protein [Methylobacterium longum]